MKLPQAILFDLDGTLADTAPDLAAAVNLMRTTRGLNTVPYAALRPHASAGARGLLGAGFQIDPSHDVYEAMKVEFIDHYARSSAVLSQLFDGISDLLLGLDQFNITWGIVTNKAAHLTDPLIPLIGLQRAACVISGDTTPFAKPHPEPLFEAARKIQILPKNCWYVGDDLRDIQAGQEAGMTTIAAAWGYCGPVEPRQWNADAILDSPLELLEIVRALTLQKESA
jgi:2-phosphoglycolate phosphatase